MAQSFSESVVILSISDIVAMNWTESSQEMASNNLVLLAAKRPLATIAEQIADALRADIVTCRIQPGEALRQSIIAQHYGVSQAPVREALALLASDELVEHQANRGVRVARLRLERAEEIAAIRLSLETDLMKAAAGRLDCQAIERAEDAIDAAALAGEDVAELLRADRAFHQAIYRPAGKPITLDIVQRLRTRNAQYLGFLWTHSSHAPSSRHEHAELLELMKAGKTDDAVDFLQRHIRSALAEIVRCLAAEG